MVEYEITPNRPDCLCMIGLAREAAVTFGKKMNLPTPRVQAKTGGDINKLAKIFIEDPLCVRYTARMVKNVKIAPSPSGCANVSAPAACAPSTTSLISQTMS